MSRSRRWQDPQYAPSTDWVRWLFLIVLGALTIVVTLVTIRTLDFRAPLIPQLVRFVYLPFLTPIFVGLVAGLPGLPPLPRSAPSPPALPPSTPSPPSPPPTAAIDPLLADARDLIAAHTAAAAKARRLADEIEDRLFAQQVKSVLATFQPPPGRPARLGSLGRPQRPGSPPATPPRPDPLHEDDLAILDADGDGRPDAPVICAVCGDPVDGDGIPCSLCGIPQHGDCWAFAGRCATYACEGRPAR